MKKHEVTIGMQVVLRHEPDATLYTVDALKGFEATLSEQSGGQQVYAGRIDICVLKKPTQQQIMLHA